MITSGHIAKARFYRQTGSKTSGSLIEGSLSTVARLLAYCQSYRFCAAGVSCRDAVFYLVGDLLEAGQCVVEELFVAVAEVAFIGGLVRVEPGSVFYAAAATIVQIATHEAFIADVLFVAGECSFDFALGKFGQWGLADVSQSPFGFDEKFAAVGVAGVFDNDEACALFAEGAHCVAA